ncbi:MAG: hypothetical protein ABIC91_04625 [Nanoarchaeota archaeon]
MKKHNHDLYYIVIVLFIATFVLSVMLKINPELSASGRAVYEIKTYEQKTPITRAITTRDQQEILSTEKLLKPIEIVKEDKKLKTSFFKSIISTDSVRERPITFSRKNVESPLSWNSDVANEGECTWLNVENKDYTLLKSMTGSDACKKVGYNQCLTINNVVEKQIYSSNNNLCQGLRFEIVNNNFDDCDQRIRTTNNPCSISEGGDDFRQNSYTTVLCCN